MQNKIAIEFYSVVRMLVCQILVQKADGSGRIAIREWVVLSKEDRDRLREISHKEQSSYLQTLVNTKGHSMAVSAKALLDNNDITQETYDFILTGL